MSLRFNYRMDTTLKKRRPTRRTAVSKAVAMLGGLTETALLVGVTPQAVHKWVKRGAVPGERCRTVEALLGGRVTRYELNPTIFGKAPAGAE